VGFVSATAAIVSLVLFLVAGIWPHIERGRDSVLDTHYQFQIRTFWINIAAFIISMLVFFVGLAGSVGAILAHQNDGAGIATGVLGVIGISIVFVVVGLAFTVWTVARSVVGLKCLHEGRPIANPKTWFV